MQRIAVVEDEESLAEMLRLNLELEGFEVVHFSHGGEALIHKQQLLNASLLVLDIMLPEVSGLEICREIRKESNMPILMLSARGTTTDRIEGLKTGANDYLPKPFDLEELLLRVKNLLPSEKETELMNMKVGDVEVSFTNFECHNVLTGDRAELSKREMELLKLFHQRTGQVVSREEILDRVWGKDQFPTSRTIDNYILSFRKIFEHDPKNPVFFHSIRGVGYKFTP